MEINEKGITLIALVVTIIVLIILAGASISMISGENGILRRAVEAKEKAELSQNQEKIDFRELEDNIEDDTKNFDIEKVMDENPGELKVDTTDNNILIINSIEDLVAFSYNVNNGNTYEGKTIKLSKDLDFGSNKSYVNPYRKDYSNYGYEDELKTELVETKGFKPIGNYQNPFKGTFDGNNKKIRNVFIKATNYTGFFGVVEDATIKNLNISGKTDTNNQREITAGIVARISSGTNTIQNCICKINTFGRLHTGGIVGLLIKKENSELNVTINQCFNYADIISNEYAAGGICGVIGNMDNLNIINCGNEGNIDGYTAGGIIGTQMYSMKGKIEIFNCYNLGNMSGSYAAGGIIGQDDGSADRKGFEIKNTYSIGKISGKGKIMGALAAITSWNRPIIENCYWKEGTYEKAIFTNNVTSIEIPSSSEEEMKNITFLNKLNENRQDGWNKWVQNSDRYPIIEKNQS